MSCIVDLNGVATLVESETKRDLDLPIQLRLNGIVHRLLDRPEERNDILEALRVGAILWIVLIKRRYRSYPGTSTIYALKLLNLMHGLEKSTSGTYRSSALDTYRLWLLVLCGISCGSSERKMALQMIVNEMRRSDIRWSETMTRARQMPWVSIFEVPCTKLEFVVESFNSGET